MKNNKQEIKFNQQVNHLQSFIGMPPWNGRNPTFSEIRENDRRILEKQALGFEPKRKSLVRYIFDGLKTFIPSESRQTPMLAKKLKASKQSTNESIPIGTECCG